MEETSCMSRVGSLDHKPEQLIKMCLRRKIILGLGYIDVTVPLRNLPVLAGCVLVQPQLVLLCLLLYIVVFILLKMLLLFSCSFKFSPPVSPSRFDFSSLPL